MKATAWYSLGLLTFCNVYYLGVMLFGTNAEDRLTNFWCIVLFTPVVIFLVKYLFPEKK